MDELAILAAHDTDGFNRYEACQRLAHLALEQRLGSDGANVAIETALIKAVIKIFEDADLRNDYKCCVCLFLVSLRLSTAQQKLTGCNLAGAAGPAG